MHFTFVAILFAFVAQVLALDIAFGNGRISSSEILAIPDSPVTQACTTNCTLAKTRIAACANDNACLCRSDTVAALQSCETCMLHFLIARNIPAPDPRAGSNVILGGYAAECAVQGIVVDPKLAALSLPATWDGPFTAVLPFGGAIVVVVIATLLGGSALFLLSNM